MNALPPAFGGAAQSYWRANYLEGIKVIGGSFSTTIADFMNGTAVSGELLYQPNLPFALSSGETLLRLFGQTPTIPFNTEPRAFGEGFAKSDSISGQLSTLSTFSGSLPVVKAINADLLVFIANWGFQYLPNIDQVTLNALAAPRSETTNPANWAATRTGQPLYHPDTFSHGLRLIAQAQYNNAFGTAVTLSPSIQIGWDLKGTSAGPVGPGFINNKKSLSLGVRGTYSKAWSAGVAWTATRGNSFQNLTDDRDFLTADISYAF
jgi:hypothetical protein